MQVQQDDVFGLWLESIWKFEDLKVIRMIQLPEKLLVAILLPVLGYNC